MLLWHRQRPQEVQKTIRIQIEWLNFVSRHVFSQKPLFFQWKNKAFVKNAVSKTIKNIINFGTHFGSILQPFWHRHRFCINFFDGPKRPQKGLQNGWSQLLALPFFEVQKYPRSAYATRPRILIDCWSPLRRFRYPFWRHFVDFVMFFLAIL